MDLKAIKLYTCTLIFMFFNQLQSSSITFGSKYSTIKIDSGAACIVEHPLYIDQGIINREEYGLIRGAPIIFINSSLVDCGNKTKFTGVLDTNNYNFILAGNNIFSGRNGTVYQPISVSGKNNLIEGNLTLCNDITLQDQNTSLSVNLISNLNGNIYLNGGLLCLMENNLKFNDNHRIFGPGTISENGSKLVYGANPLTFGEKLYFVGAEDIQLNANSILESTWTFSGEAILDGNYNNFDLDEYGKIIIERGSSLLIKNLTMHDIQDGKLLCMDNSATVTFQNVKIYFSNDYTFSTGKFAIEDQVTFLGESKFIYQSSMASIITSRSTLILDSGMTFSYDPGCMRKDLIVFEDPYSLLNLNGATLHATLTGMQLKNGWLIVSRNSYLSSERTSNLDEGITFGNDSPQDDIYCDIAKGTKLSLIEGSLKYKNTIESTWSMGNNTSTLFINSGCNFYLYQNLNLGIGQITFMGGNFYSVFGKEIAGSTNVGGTLNYVEL